MDYFHPGCYLIFCREYRPLFSQQTKAKKPTSLKEFWTMPDYETARRVVDLRETNE
jgi:hypothetical protein